MAFIKPTKIFSGDKSTTSNIYLGKPEAEGEIVPGQSLAEYYQDYLHIDNAFTRGYFIITGRKGVGKSAYVKHLMDNAGEENELYCDVITNDKIDLEKVLQAVPESVGNKDEIIYEWIILTRLVKLLLQNHNAKCAEGYSSLEKFESKNSGIANVEKWMTMEEQQSNGWTVNFSELWKGFPFAFNKQFQHKNMRAPFYSLIHPLREIVKKMLTYEVNKDINFIVFFDDLDVKFKLRNETHKERLMSLLRMTKQYNTQVLPTQDARIMVMLRDDIALQLEGVATDKNKTFSSYEYNLNWFDSDAKLNEEETSLRKFINRRIEVSFAKLGIEYDRDDPWNTLIDNRPCPEYNYKSAFKFILDCTFYRPRDLVALFKDIDNRNYKIPMQPNDIKTLLRSYVEWNASEIKDELSNLYTSTEIESLFHIFEIVATPNCQMRYNDIITLFEEEGLSESDMEKMLEYNFLIPKDGNEFQYFSYRERPRVGKKENYVYRLPKCLYIYFHPNFL